MARLQVMWLQPWFFSMLFLHLGQGLVCAMSHLALPPSSTCFFAQTATSLHEAGRCAASRQAKQKAWPCAHSTSCAGAPSLATTLSQPGAGQARTAREVATKERARKAA